VPNPVEPAFALLAFLGLSVVGLLAFWPEWGLLARYRRRRRSSLRVTAEDVLKQLLRAEHAEADASVDALAGAIGISRHAASSTLQRLAEQGLVSLESDRFGLTEPGREYALRILRTHRLWERYLADRTGVRPEHWHDSAEEAEHELSLTEVDALASRLGHPLYDPHGDPIPGGMVRCLRSAATYWPSRPRGHDYRSPTWRTNRRRCSATCRGSDWHLAVGWP